MPKAMSFFTLSDDDRNTDQVRPLRETPIRNVESCIRKLAEENPYRVLGVFANSSQKDLLANASRMSAFLRVKRQIPFSTDSIGNLSIVQRSEETVNQARAALALPTQRLQHALFWFMKSSPEDSEALRRLEQGEHVAAETIWEEKSDVTARHNLILCRFLSCEGEQALRLLGCLYAESSAELGRLVDSSLCPTEEDLVDIFLSELNRESPDSILSLAVYVTRPVWKSKLSRYMVDRLIKLIHDWKEKPSASGTVSLDAAKSLVMEALPILQGLESLVGIDDTTYTNLSDQVATEVLQCAIQYFNHQEAAHTVVSETLPVMELARKIARGSAVRKRCDENIFAVRRITSQLPDESLGEEGQSVYCLIREIKKQIPTVDSLNSFLREVRPYLKILRGRLGKSNEGYLNLSARVVDCTIDGLFLMLARAVERMQQEEEKFKKAQVMASYGADHVLESALSYRQAYADARQTLEDSWKIMRSLEFFDMLNSFRRGTYTKKRSDLKKICVGASIKTVYFTDFIRRYPKCFCALIILAIAFLMFQANEIERSRSREIDVIRQDELREKQSLERKIARQYHEAKTLEDYEKLSRRCAAYLKKYKKKSSRSILEIRRNVKRNIEDIKRERLQSKAKELEDRYDHAETSFQYDVIAQEARGLARDIPSMSKLASKADQRAEDLRREEKARIHDQLWGSESRAWSTVQTKKSIEAYRNYLKYYPKGIHANRVNKLLIDAEVDSVIKSGKFSEIPESTYTETSTTAFANIEISNNTSYTLTIRYSGSTSTKLTIPPHNTKTIELVPATYNIVASVNDSDIMPLAGAETYKGGNYRITYYISTRTDYKPRYRTSLY